MKKDGPTYARDLFGALFAGGDGENGSLGKPAGGKAVTSLHSPSPGGSTERFGADEYTWGLRPGVSAVSGGLAGKHETAESGYDFVLHDADEELFMRQDCPEIPHSKKQKAER